MPFHVRFANEATLAPIWLAGETAERVSNLIFYNIFPARLDCEPSSKWVLFFVSINRFDRPISICGIMRQDLRLPFGPRKRMSFQLKRAGTDNWIYACIHPPCRFITVAMDLAIMSSAQRYREFIANLAA